MIIQCTDYTVPFTSVYAGKYVHKTTVFVYCGASPCNTKRLSYTENSLGHAQPVETDLHDLYGGQ